MMRRFSNHPGRSPWPTTADRWREALASADAAMVAEAAFNLGLLYSSGSDRPAAERLLRRAVDLDVSPFAARAALALHRLYVDLDARSEADAWLRDAERLSAPADSPDVSLAVAERLIETEPATAQRLLLSVLEIERQNAPGSVEEGWWTHVHARAELTLGGVYLRTGDVSRAIDHLQTALKTNEPAVAPRAALMLAQDVGLAHLRPTHVERLLELAVYFNDPEISPRASLALADFLESKGIVNEPRRLREEVSASCQRGYAARAEAALAAAAEQPVLRQEEAALKQTVRRLGTLGTKALQQMSRRPPRVLIIGAGTGGQDLCDELSNSQVVGFLDDALVGREFGGSPVIGDLSDTMRALTERHVDEVLFAIPSAPGVLRRRVLDACREARVPMRTLPPMGELLLDRSLQGQLRDVRIDDLLGSRRMAFDRELGEAVRSRSVLIAGAAGSIGREIARQIARARCRHLVLLDRNESELANVYAELVEQRRLAGTFPEVADMGDETRMDQIMRLHQPDVVFCAAGYSHAHLMEHNALEAMRNNVFATRRFMRACGRAMVDACVLVSSDDAATMRHAFDASKALAELAVQHDQRAYPDTRYVTVRLGNVYPSAGAVMDRFESQIRRGGPVLVTSADARRRLLSVFHAVQLLLRALEFGESGGLYAIDAGDEINIIDLAKEMIRLDGRELEIEFVGSRVGEKTTDRMYGAGERPLRTHDEAIIGIERVPVAPDAIKRALDLVEKTVEAGDTSGLRNALLTCLPEWLATRGADTVFASDH